jgi:WD40 repeat protein
VFLYYCQASGVNGAGKTVSGGAQAFHINFKRLISEKDAGAKKATLVALERRTDHRLNCLAFSPNGKMAATGDESGQIQLWNMDNGWKMDPLKGPERIRSLAFSPDGKFLAASANDLQGYNPVIAVFDVSDHKEVRRFNDNEEHARYACIAFSPDGKIIVAGGLRNKVKLWEAATGKLRERLNAPNRYSNEGINGVAFSPDGLQLATAADDGSIRFWDMATYKEVAVLRAENGLGAKSVAWSADGKTIGVGYENGVAGLWNISAKKLREILKSDDRHHVDGVAFSSDGTLLATTQGQGSTVNLWQVANGKKLAALKAQSLGGSVAFSPDDQFLAAIQAWANAGDLVVWNVPAALEQKPEKP